MCKLSSHFFNKVLLYLTLLLENYVKITIAQCSPLLLKKKEGFLYSKGFFSKATILAVKVRVIA